MTVPKSPNLFGSDRAALPFRTAYGPFPIPSIPLVQEEIYVRLENLYFVSFDEVVNGSQLSPNRARYFRSRSASFGLALESRETANSLRPAADREQKQGQSRNRVRTILK